MRQDNAYCAPAAFFLGLALWDILQSLALLLSKLKTASKTPIWRVASVTWIFMATFFVLQYMVLDYITSPYEVSNDFFGNLFIFNFIFIFLTTFGVGVMLMTRIRVFYGRPSPVYIIMMVLFIGTVGLKGSADAFGVIVGLDVRRNKYLVYEDHPLYPYVPFYFAIGQVTEAIFSTVGSIAFLYAISNEGGKSKTKVLQGIIIKDYVIRLVLIFGLNITITVFGIIAWLNHGHYTYITHMANYLPTTTYALQFYTFLKNSYITARTIIEKKQNSSSREASGIDRFSSQKPFKSDVSIISQGEGQSPLKYNPPNQFPYNVTSASVPSKIQGRESITNPYTPPNLRGSTKPIVEDDIRFF
ncbi:hypothetical protein HK103_007129 [Boothiomyces macroporosus]|uniref:Uncharacterized protein n=1 Tax=Boothiomyces macroporosus TaxID=261099 RepID=A0AAD5Y233_9FUNG|nr:hypothetical protein HK103_007129 [Boothiomyces macroporosus]